MSEQTEHRLNIPHELQIQLDDIQKVKPNNTGICVWIYVSNEIHATILCLTDSHMHDQSFNNTNFIYLSMCNNKCVLYTKIQK